MSDELLRQAFFVLLVGGLFLVGAELFAPGAILGILGGIALFVSVLIAFKIYEMSVAVMITLGIVILIGVAVYLWAKYFPKTAMGQRMTVSTDLSSAKASQNDLEQLIGKTGEASSELRPGGFALINGKRIDVVTQGEMLSAGEKIIVVKVEGNRVVVRKNN